LYVADVKIFSFFLAPMRGDAFFCHSMHFVRPDLNFHSFAIWADNTGVQRLIHIGFRHGDIVFEPPRNGAPMRMNDAQCFVSFSRSVHENPKTDQIIDLIVKQILTFHLLVNTEEVLGPAGHIGFDPFGLEFARND
jgi:hypothetical protein